MWIMGSYTELLTENSGLVLHITEKQEFYTKVADLQSSNQVSGGLGSNSMYN
jgi:hypothetical protein